MRARQSYAGKLAVITGGASGLGLALAENLKEQGARVVILDKVSTATDFDFKQIDVRSAKALDDAVQSIEAKLGPIDLAIGNAAIDITGEAQDFSSDDWRNVIETNFLGCTNLVSALYGRMVERRSGQLVFVSSGAGLIGFPLGVPYTSSKAGLIGLAKALRTEARRYSIRVNVACPPILETPLLMHGAAKPGIDRPAFIKSLQKTPMPAPEAANRILTGAAKDKAQIIFPVSLLIAERLAHLFPGIGEAIRKDVLKRFERHGRG